ncbi:MAG: tetratricopeptide repeat protein [Bacteroidota bacterium]
MRHLVCGILLLVGWAPAQAQDHFGRGRASLAARDTASAVAAFTDAVRAGQKPSEANYHLGAIALARGRLQDALRFLEEAVRIDDDNVEALKGLADAHLRAKNPAEGLRVLRVAAKAAPKDCGVTVLYGLVLLASDSTDAALVQLTRGKECAPEDPAVYEGLGDAYLRQNVLVLGISNYQKAVELDPRNVELRYRLARAFEKNKQYTDAVKVYDEVIANDTTYADAYFQKGSILYRAKLYPRAVDPLRKYLALRSDSFDANIMLARTYLETKAWTDAAAAGERAVRLDSSAAETWRTWFHALVEIKDFARAEGALASLQRRDSLEVQDYLKLGDLYFGLKRREDATRWYLRAVEADSTSCEPHFNLGFLYMQEQNWAAAAASFEKKITCDQNSLSAYVNAAASYMQIKNMDRARELLVRSIQLKEDFFQGRLWLARYYVQADSFDAARGQYEEVLRLIGDNTERYRKEAGEAHSLLASLFVTRRDYARALESFRRAAALGYENGGMHLSWGQAVLQTLDPGDTQENNQRRKEEAVRHFRRSVELDPNTAAGHLWLAEGLVLLRIPGDDENNRRLQEEACSEYRKALRLDPRNEDAKKGMERINC